MAFDDDLADRVRGRLADERGVTDKAMFGTLVFLLDGHMAVGIRGHELMVRVGADAVGDALAQPHARPADMGGRTMKGWIIVAPAALGDDGGLGAWVSRGVGYARSLPPKS
jgi:hypothetical protein